MTIACLAVGVQGGHALSSLVLSAPEPAPVAAFVIDDAPDDVDEIEAMPTRPAPKPVAWCSDPALCFVDLDELSRQLSVLPRGMRLVRDGEGMRIDGARGLLTSVGLRNGDVLLAIDEQPLPEDGGMELLAGATRRGGFSLRYRRDGEVLAKRINFVVS